MKIRLVVFDVDGTLTQHSSIWWRLHELFGTTKKGREYYDQFFAGEITYEQWADYDAGLWKGQPLEVVMKDVQNTRLIQGAQETIQILKQNDVRTAILSGGLDVMADDVAQRVGIDYVLTNRLLHQNGLLTGSVEYVVGWSEKDIHIKSIAEHFGIKLEQTAFVGDGHNDISVFSVVGMSIAFNPEGDAVANAATVVIRDTDLRSILPFVISEFQQ